MCAEKKIRGEMRRRINAGKYIHNSDNAEVFIRNEN